MHVVIIGFANFDINEKRIFEYENIKAEPHELKVKNINPYLVEGKDLIIVKRRKPICNVPEISFGSMPNDGGFLLLEDKDKEQFIKDEPGSEKYLKPLLSAHEFINGKNRWCLWLKNISPTEINQLQKIKERVRLVKEYREKSTREATKKLAAFPSLFGEIRQP